jgi:hypothetical protein
MLEFANCRLRAAIVVVCSERERNLIGYLWTLENGDDKVESGLSSLPELKVILDGKSLHGMVPVEWIVETMQNEESKDGRSFHHHDVPAPNNWTLSWSRLRRRRCV